LLTKLQPRLYSVASCLRVYPDSVHFIVDVIRYESHGRLRKGVASTFLAERCNDQPVPVFPSVAKHFHLPEGDADIIMVGPGTGIAPFRAFLQERRAVGARRSCKKARKRSEEHRSELQSQPKLVFRHLTEKKK